MEIELQMTEQELKEHEAYLDEFKSILDGLNDLEKKYAHLCPNLGTPRKEDGSIDYSKMGLEYKKHLMNFKATIHPIHSYSLIPSVLNDVSKGLKRDSRRIDKKDFLAIREIINQKLDEIESMCCSDYDYDAAIKANQERCDASLKEMEQELDNLEKLRESKIF